MIYSWTPTAAEVATMVPNRTQDPSRTFTATTYPTLNTVSSIISMVCEEVAAFAGNPDSLLIEAADPTTSAVLDSLCGAARRCAIFGAAAQVEVSFTSEDVKDGGGKAGVLSKEYSDALGRLRKAVSEYDQGQVIGGQNDSQPMKGAFPEPHNWKIPPGMISNDTTGLYGVDPTWGIW